MESGKKCADIFVNRVKLYMPARDESVLRKLSEESSGKGSKIIPLTADITCSEDICKIVDDMGQIDLVINCAGINIDNLIYNIKPEDWNLILKTNYYFVVELYETLKQNLNKNSVFISISSISGIRAKKGQCAYSVSKAMLTEWTRQIAEAENNTTFFTLSPGPVNTSMIKGTKWFEEQKEPTRIPLK